MGKTPLHFACELDKIEIVKLLISKGSRIEDKNIMGKTPFDIAKSTEVKSLFKNQ